MEIEKIIKFDMNEIKDISTIKQLYYLLDIIPKDGNGKFNCSLVYINKKQNEDILAIILSNTKCNKKLYNIKWKHLKQILVDEWIKYSPNIDITLSVPYGEIWLIQGWNTL